jgi:hypothetical protein
MESGQLLQCVLESIGAPGAGFGKIVQSHHAVCAVVTLAEYFVKEPGFGIGLDLVVQLPPLVDILIVIGMDDLRDVVTLKRGSAIWKSMYVAGSIAVLIAAVQGLSTVGAYAGRSVCRTYHA